MLSTHLDSARSTPHQPADHHPVPSSRPALSVVSGTLAPLHPHFCLYRLSPPPPIPLPGKRSRDLRTATLTFRKYENLADITGRHVQTPGPPHSFHLRNNTFSVHLKFFPDHPLLLPSRNNKSSEFRLYSFAFLCSLLQVYTSICSIVLYVFKSYLNAIILSASATCLSCLIYL